MTNRARFSYLGDISRRLAAAFTGYHTKVRTALVRVLPGVVEAGLRAAGTSFGIDIGSGVFRPEDSPPSHTLEVLLPLPPQAATRTGTRVLVVLDEFQAIEGDVGQADAVLRSQIQHQRDHVSYLLSGSGQGILRGLFSERAARPAPAESGYRGPVLTCRATSTGCPADLVAVVTPSSPTRSKRDATVPAATARRRRQPGRPRPPR